MVEEVAPYKLWKLEDKDVAKADQIREKINVYLSIIQTQTFTPNGAYASLATPRKIKQAVGEIRKISEKKKGEHLLAFDRLVLEDVLRNAEIAEVYCDYRYNLNTPMKVGTFIGKVLGRGAYGDILEAVSKKNYPHSLVHRYGVATHESSSRQLSVDDIFTDERTNPMFHEAKKTLLTKLKDYKNLAEDFYRDMGVAKDMKEFNFEFCPPGYFFSYWDDANFMIHIDPERAIFYKRSPEGRLILEDSAIGPIVIHEGGHGFQKKISDKTMPRGLAPSAESYVPMIHGPCGEGTALATETFWRDYAKKKKLFSREELKLIDLQREVYIPSKLPSLAHDLLEQNERENRTDTRMPEHLIKYGHETLAKISGIKMYEDFFHFTDRTIDETLQQMTYFFGQRRIGGFIEKMENHGMEAGEIMRCLFQGTWCDAKAQENFIFDLLLNERA
jgi:hypothetical protein